MIAVRVPSKQSRRSLSSRFVALYQRNYVFAGPHIVRVLHARTATSRLCALLQQAAHVVRCFTLSARALHDLLPAAAVRRIAELGVVAAGLAYLSRHVRHCPLDACIGS